MPFGGLRYLVVRFRKTRYLFSEVLGIRYWVHGYGFCHTGFGIWCHGICFCPPHSLIYSSGLKHHRTYWWVAGGGRWFPSSEAVRAIGLVPQHMHKHHHHKHPRLLDSNRSMIEQWVSDRCEKNSIRQWVLKQFQWNLDNSNCRGTTQKKFSYEKFELCYPFALAMWPPQRVYFALVYSISWLNFLEWDFLLVWKEDNEIKLVTQECKHIQPQKRYWMALTAVVGSIHD